jgi:hypothetical protein
VNRLLVGRTGLASHQEGSRRHVHRAWIQSRGWAVGDIVDQTVAVVILEIAGLDRARVDGRIAIVAVGPGGAADAVSVAILIGANRFAPACYRVRLAARTREQREADDTQQDQHNGFVLHGPLPL